MEELAQVYGRSLFEVAREHGRLDELREQLGQFADALDQNHELAVFFFSPYFSTKEKQESLGGLLEGADEIFVNFLDLLIENHRMPVIFRIRQEYERLWEEENRMLPVEITSAIALDHDDHREPRPDDRRARRAQGHARRARGPRHPRRHHHQGRQLDPRRLYSQPTGAAAQARCPRSFLEGGEVDRRPTGRARASISQLGDENMQINPDEITSILKSRIEGLDSGTAELTEVGTVLSVADGIARLHGLENCMSFEMLELPHGVTGPGAEPRVRQRRRGPVRRVGAHLRGRHRQAHRLAAGDPGRRADAWTHRRPARAPARRQGRDHSRADAARRVQGSRRRPAPAGHRTDADRPEGDRRDDPDRPRPARADHRRPPDRQDGDRDRHDHQQQGHRRGVGIRGHRSAHVDGRGARADARGVRRDGEHDHRGRARRRGGADQVHGALRGLRDGRALPLQRRARALRLRRPHQARLRLPPDVAAAAPPARP